MSISFTDRELDVMAVLWQRGSGTVAEVRDALADDFARTTVLTVLRILEDKGYVAHKVEGKAHRYRPTVKPEAAGRSALGRILQTMFEGSHERLLAQLVSDRRISRDKLKRLRAELDARLNDTSDGEES
ncbi:MAG TPA: BlaI/MecI/CopY family transcriptional regulator [Gemmatimonadaceae bacterium]|jgi:predicted transcriptional regulator